MKELMNRDDESHLLEGNSVREANVPYSFIMHYELSRILHILATAQTSRWWAAEFTAGWHCTGEILLKSKCALTICHFLLFTSVILSQTFLVFLLSVCLAL